MVTWNEGGKINKL